MVDYASIILGIIGAPVHQELSWHNVYMHFPDQVARTLHAISFDQVHCSLIISNKFLMFTSRTCFRGQHTTFSNAGIQPLRKVRILIVTTFKLLSFFICLYVRIIGTL